MRIIVLITFIFSFFLAEAQNVNSAYSLIWRAKPKLMWRDFNGKAKKKYEHSAMSSVSLNQHVRVRGDEIEVSIQSYFRKDLSWVKEEDKSDFLLKHEQIHFDICEVVARKYRKELKETKLNQGNLGSKIDELSRKYKAMNTELQTKYDEETDHSLNNAEQLKWNTRIETELESLSDFAETDFKIKMN